jgi:hypothetical protein
MSNNQNPLQGYFRSPKLYTKIPSQGLFYIDDDVVDMPENGELAIFPMTAKDEMIMKNPDALLNGESVAQVIKSCVPAVNKARSLISNDVDALLIAIQGATYGDEVNISGTCPECDEPIESVASIEMALDTMSIVEESYIHKTAEGLELEIRPFTYESSVKAGIANFQTSRSLQSIQEIEDEVEQLRQFNTNFMQVAALNFELIVDSVASVRGKDAEGEEFLVTDRNNIREFLENSESSIGKAVEAKIADVNKVGVNKEVQLECEKCEVQFTKEIGFDPVNFFTAS